MAKKGYWNAFATGAAVGAAASTGALLFSNVWGRAGKSRIIRLEKSVQVGRPVEDVFNAWRQIERLPQLSHIIDDVRREGNRSHWKVNVNGRVLQWDALIEQLIPNQAIGWKSVGGVKHTGRISFSPLGSDTLVHVTMNYAPPMRFLRPFLASMSGQLEGYIENVLRDFKRALEGGEVMQSGPRTYTGGTTTEPVRSTGTFGPGQTQTSETQHSRFRGPGGQGSPNPVDYTAPPEAKR